MLILTYDLSKPKPDYKGMFEELEAAGAAEVAESVWLIPNTDDWSGWTDRVAKHVTHAGDRVFVAVIDTSEGSRWGAKNTICGVDWLNSNFR